LKTTGENLEFRKHKIVEILVRRFIRHSFLSDGGSLYHLKLSGEAKEEENNPPLNPLPGGEQKGWVTEHRASSIEHRRGTIND